MQFSASSIRVATIASAFAVLPTATLIFNPHAADGLATLISNMGWAEPLNSLTERTFSGNAIEADFGAGAGDLQTMILAFGSLLLLAMGSFLLRQSKRKVAHTSEIDDGRILAAMCYVARASGGMDLEDLGRIFTQVTGHVATKRQLAAAYRAFNADDGGIELTPFARADSDAEKTAIMTGALRVAWADGRLRQSAQHFLGMLAGSLGMSEARVLELFDGINNPKNKRWT